MGKAEALMLRIIVEEGSLRSMGHRWLISPIVVAVLAGSSKVRADKRVGGA